MKELRPTAPCPPPPAGLEQFEAALAARGEWAARLENLARTLKGESRDDSGCIMQPTE